MITFMIYEDKNGKKPFVKYMDRLDKRSQAQVYRRISAIQTHGIKVSSENEWVKSLKGSELFEIRVRVGNNQERILCFHKSHEFYVITHGFTKKTQQTPTAEIERALRIMKLYRNEENQ